jgi:hypothetical protein
MRVSRIIFLSLVGLGLSVGAFAQEINGGVNLSFPTGTTLFGFSARFENSINSDFQWMVTPGLQFGGGATFIFLQGGVKHTLRETPVYFAFEVGPVIGSGSGNSDTRFGFTPSVGYKLDQKWDFSFLLFGGLGSTFVGLRGAYVFKR